MIETMLPKSICETQKGFKLLELWAVDSEPRRGWLKYYEEPLLTAPAVTKRADTNANRNVQHTMVCQPQLAVANPKRKGHP